MIFRRDLRLADNTALALALEQSDAVIPSFICDPRQLEENPYRGDNAVQFLVESLEDLEEQLRQRRGRLFYFWGQADEVIEQVLSHVRIGALFVNRDYTPFARRRDEALQRACEARGVRFFSCADALLHEPEQVLKPDGSPYTMFTPFFKRSAQHPVHEPSAVPKGKFFLGEIASQTGGSLDRMLTTRSKSLFTPGGRAAGLKLIKGIASLGDYATDRNRPDIRGTSGLSAHHKFGTVSVRETYHATAKFFGESHPLLTELHWRDFFTHIGFHFPHVFGEAFHTKYAAIRWRADAASFERWCRGETGFPIVDAGMRQLNSSGWMHNRVRMIVASFLTKDLHIDWRLGERYFATRLIDYDPAVNNGNWQWSASVGCDAAPYFRIFNPWLQQKRFDPQAAYIKRWVPELKTLAAEEIHSLHRRPNLTPRGYPQPMVDHSIEAEIAKKMFKDLRA
uniref:Deoxyribodipyrimidine photo-lyase n=1 Tax=uncultured bacterium pAW1 TaxID=1781155 RepID=A0A1C9U4P2_9BACT|nr:deoxyribodipyrimidine photo-lyase [uncultured bacterium pAW1]